MISLWTGDQIFTSTFVNNPDSRYIKTVRMKPSFEPGKHTSKIMKKEASRAAAGKSFSQKYAFLLLILLPLVVYFKTLSFDFTKLDDHIFIQENKEYNSNPANILGCFRRGLFVRNADVFYRPVLIADFILESQFFGANPKGFHFTNLLFQICCVLLLYLFLRKIDIPDTNALVLALIFSVHPVLSQAVAWIPGRNDMLLVLFFFATALLVIDYIRKPRWMLFAGQLLFLLLALFTKETGVIIPVILMSFILLKYRASWKRWLPLLVSWVVALMVWFFMRKASSIGKEASYLPGLIHTAIPRLPAILQYLGKIFFPVNQSVYPSINETTYFWGILALVLLTALIIYSRSYKKPLTIIGLAWYILFLIPVFMVPADKNDQIFEHRLYLPLIGILLILSQTILFSKEGKKEWRPILAVGVIVVFAVMSYFHSNYFSDAITFWNKAVEDNPESGMAKMILGTYLTDPAEQEKVYREAYKLDPHLKVVNLMLGKIAMSNNRNAEAKKYFLDELKLTKMPGTYNCLAHIYVLDNNLDSAAYCLKQSMDIAIQSKREKESYVPELLDESCHNLVLVYMNLKKQDMALQVIKEMMDNDIPVSQELIDLTSAPVEKK
jgi:tetratricopeptide (TPR) repeat protein